MKNKYNLALFDMDGTLIDSMDRWISIIGEFMDRNKIIITDELISNINTLNLEETIHFLIKYYGLKRSYQESIDDLDKMMMDYYMHHAKLKPGAVELLHRMKEKTIPMAIATATKDLLAIPALEKQGLKEFFTFIQTTENAGFPKARPEYWKIAAERGKKDTNEVVVIEDSLYAASLVHTLGMKVIGVEDKSGEQHKEEMLKISKQFVTNLNDVDLRWFE